MTALRNLDAYLETATLCANAAREAVTPLFRTAFPVETKSDLSPVTIADQKAERAIRAILKARHPEHSILGEEFGSEQTRSEWLWVIDPVDGTRAFITGRPHFTCLVALLHEEKPVLGLIDQPITGERWIGIQGRPTTFESTSLPGRVGTRICPDLACAELSCTSPEMLSGIYEQRFAHLKMAARRTSWGGDAYAYGLMALGQIDLIAECTMKPWDWAALVPVIEGAGGKITDWQGRTLSLEGDGTVLASGDPTLLAHASACLHPSPQ